MKFPDDNSDVVSMQPASHSMQSNGIAFQKLDFGRAFATLPTNNAEEKESDDEIAPKECTKCASTEIPFKILHIVDICVCECRQSTQSRNVVEKYAVPHFRV